MEYRNLGSSGLKVSRLIFGGTHIGEMLDEAETRALVHEAWDVGVSTFYTGDDYSLGENERIMGAALRERRDDVVLIVKCGYRRGAYNTYSQGGFPKDGEEDYTNQRLGRLDHARLWDAGVAPTSRGMSRKHLTAALEQSLRNLGTDYIDVYAPHYYDPEVPVEETLDTLDGFVKSGKVRYLGCSQHTPWQLYHALWTSDRLGLSRYEFVQTNVNVFERTALGNECPALARVGVSLVASVSDAGGMVTGAYRRGDERPSGGGPRQRYIDPFWNDAIFDAMDQLRVLAEEFGRPAGELAQAWVLAQEPIVALMIGPHEPGEVRPAAAAASTPLRPDELAALDALVGSWPVSMRQGERGPVTRRAR